MIDLPAEGTGRIAYENFIEIEDERVRDDVDGVHTCGRGTLYKCHIAGMRYTFLGGGDPRRSIEHLTGAAPFDLLRGRRWQRPEYRQVGSRSA
jgi:hypothetical protein